MQPDRGHGSPARLRGGSKIARARRPKGTSSRRRAFPSRAANLKVLERPVRAATCNSGHYLNGRNPGRSCRRRNGGIAPIAGIPDGGGRPSDGHRRPHYNLDSRQKERGLLGRTLPNRLRMRPSRPLAHRPSGVSRSATYFRTKCKLDKGRCQRNGGSSPRGATRPLAGDDLCLVEDVVGSEQVLYRVDYGAPWAPGTPSGSGAAFAALPRR